MSLTSGTRIGPYEILSAIGAGGMGEVYRARDTKLNREVALKILPEAFALDGDRIARFRREAQVLAALNHPNIAAIYGFEDSGVTHALVLELVEGPTLADRIAKGPIPLDEALPIAKQIAEALEAAHEQGIIHRDLKPANIKVRDDGTVKVLDFGLAKALEPASAISPMMTGAPTITTPAQMTGVGMILGTAAYMSPEQAKGRPADKRSDVWAFGCVLYEMLTGKRAFEGEDTADTLANVLKSNPDWNALQGIPSSLRELLQQTLEKNRSTRIASASTLFHLLTRVNRASVTDSQLAKPALWSRVLPWTLAVIATTIAIAIKMAPSSQSAAHVSKGSLRISMQMGADAELDSAGATSHAPAISPDGQALAFVARLSSGSTQMFVRRLDQLEATPVAGTEGAALPCFSPDAKWIAFFANGKLKKVGVAGGTPVALTDVASPRTITWDEDDKIFFTANTGVLKQVAASGGTPESITSLVGDELVHRLGEILPGQQAIYTAGLRPGTYEGSIVVQHLPGGSRKEIVSRGTAPRYLPSGYLTFIHDGNLLAAPFDISRLEITGPTVPVITGVGPNGVSISTSGTVVYTSDASAQDAPLDWMDKSGTITSMRKQVSDWNNPKFSPDGQSLALSIRREGHADIWIYDIRLDTLRRLTSSSGDDSRPQWTPDGKRIAFVRRGGKASGVYWLRADGTGAEQRLLEGEWGEIAWHPSEKLFTAIDRSLNTVMFTLSGDDASGWKVSAPTTILPATGGAAFSPDGKWIAYWTRASGEAQVFVQPFPSLKAKWQVSKDPSVEPIWSRARHELFIRSSTDNRLWVVSYSVAEGEFRSDPPLLWSRRAFANRPAQHPVDVHPDGNRIVMAPAGDSDRQDHVTIAFNLFDKLGLPAASSR